MLPLEPDERITTIMPLPEDEASWATLDVIFATTRGTVRRNKLSDFSEVRRNGIIAMKLDEGEAIVDVATASENDDVLLTTKDGQCIRFAVPEVRVFQGRTSMGVRGISSRRRRPRDFAVDPQAFRGRRRRARGLSEDAPRRCAARRAQDVGGETERRGGRAARRRRAFRRALRRDVAPPSRTFSHCRENGYGKRTSSFEYRITGRGGKGIVAMAVNERNGPLVASFPVEDCDEIMLVTDGGQLIRCPVEGIRITGRGAQGVIVFNTAEDEKVVSVEHIGDVGGEEESGEEAEG